MTGGQNKMTLWETSDYKVNVNRVYIKLVDINERVRHNRVRLSDEIDPMRLKSLICTHKPKLPCI